MVQQSVPDQQKQVKKAKVILWIGLTLIVVVGVAIAVFFVFFKPVTDGGSDIASSGSACPSLSEKDCRARADCLAVDICQPDTDRNQAKKCGTESMGGLCIAAGFDHCEDLDCESNTNIANNINTISNTNSTVAKSDVWIFNGSVSIECQQVGDCKFVDSTYDYSEYCGPPPSCPSDYDKDEYVVVNKESLESLIAKERGVVGRNVVCPISIYEMPSCSDLENKYIMQCVNNRCVKTLNSANSQTYEDKINGYSAEYPADYLIKLQTDNFVVFDPVSLDTPDTTYLNISVMVEDNDFHTYRLGLLTEQSYNPNLTQEEDIIISSINGKKITLFNTFGGVSIHNIVSYLGKIYDISSGNSVDQDLVDSFIENFSITQFDASVDISDTTVFENKSCVSSNECGAYPCLDGTCLVQACTSDSECPQGTCGQYVTPVPGYCTMVDSL